MGAIEEQIKELMRKKAKIEAFQKVAEDLLNLAKSAEAKDSEDVRIEVANEIIGFCNEAVQKIELGATIRPSEPQPQVSQPANEGVGEQVKLAESPPSSPVEDKIRFAMKNKHLSGKQVRIKTPDGLVEGTVRGLNAPNIIVETATGHVVPVGLAQVELIDAEVASEL